MSASLAQTIVSEIGTDLSMSKWPDAKHFCSWLGLAPKNDISGGKVLQSRTMKNRTRAAQAFRMVAQSVTRSHCACGAFSRRLKGRLGPAQALGATAHKIARTVPSGTTRRPASTPKTLAGTAPTAPPGTLHPQGPRLRASAGGCHRPGTSDGPCAPPAAPLPWSAGPAEAP
jgi:hypothetical protein